MKFLRLAAIGLSATIIAACGGHGYEGKWEIEAGNSVFTKTMVQSGAGSFILGDDYIEANGKRNSFDEIFVRESDGKKYLVMSKDGDEKSIEIVDDQTLQQDMGMVTLTYKRK